MLFSVADVAGPVHQNRTKPNQNRPTMLATTTIIIPFREFVKSNGSVACQDQRKAEKTGIVTGLRLDMIGMKTRV
jgi:hypothetical protein